MAQENPQVRRSLDEVEKAYWNPGPSPLDAPLTPCTMLPAIPTCEDAPLTALSLDGDWELAPDGYTKDRVAGDWADAIPARVPGTVHTALLEHGDIPDPMVGRNDKLARENSYRVWWMKRRFSAASLEGEPTLIFEGVCYRARFWLNGTYLGEHSGMFGGPTYPVGHLLREENTLVAGIIALAGSGGKCRSVRRTCGEERRIQVGRHAQHVVIRPAAHDVRYPEGFQVKLGHFFDDFPMDRQVDGDRLRRHFIALAGGAGGAVVLWRRIGKPREFHGTRGRVTGVLVGFQRGGQGGFLHVFDDQPIDFRQAGGGAGTRQHADSLGSCHDLLHPF